MDGSRHDPNKNIIFHRPENFPGLVCTLSLIYERESGVALSMKGRAWAYLILTRMFLFMFQVMWRSRELR